MRLSGRDRWPDDSAGRLLYLGLLPAWGLPGLADWACHRRSRIEDPERGGVRESGLHLLMFMEGAIPLGLTLLAESNPLVVSILGVSAAVHQVTANWDLRVAQHSDREVSPFEQQVHTALEAIPFVVCLLSALQGQKSEGWTRRPWELRRKSRPLPAAYVMGILLATGLTGVLPHLEEFWRCARKAAHTEEIDAAERPTITQKDWKTGEEQAELNRREDLPA